MARRTPALGAGWLAVLRTERIGARIEAPREWRASNRGCPEGCPTCVRFENDGG